MAKIVEHQSRDVDDHAQALDGWQQRYEQLGGGRFEGRAWQLVMNEGTLLREHTNRHLREQITPPPDHLVLAVPLAVMPGSTFGGRPLDRESLLIFGADDEYDLVSAGELDLIGLSVHRDVLAGLAPSKVEWLERAQQERNLGLSPDSASAIRQMLMAVTAQTEEDGALDRLEGRGQAEELLTATLTQTVILAMHSEESHQAQTIPRRADTRLKVVKRAIEYMRAHLHEDIGVPEICAAAFASRRSLQYCFEEFLQTTPQAYLRALRLNEARRALKLRTDLPITVIASDLGFSSASHFTRHYKLMFDELPSETLKACSLGSSTSLF